MSDKTKRLLVLLLIAGPTAACSSSCSSYCSCSSRGLTSVPQYLPTTIIRLYLWGNSITALNQSDFSRYSRLTLLYLQNNQISVINSRAFYSLTMLTTLNLYHNQLTILRPDMFVGLDNLQYFYLDHNNIHSIEAGTFNAIPQLRTLTLRYNQLTSLRSDIFMELEHLRYLYLSQNNIRSIEAGAFNATRRLRTLRLYNNSISSIAAGDFANLPLDDIDLADNYINTFPVEAFLNLNTSALSSTLRMNHNQMETLPSAAYDILASFRYAYIHNNPWQCDCRMLPFKQRMNGSYPFESQITCAGPSNLKGLLLLAVNPEDLICEETTTTDSTGTPPGGFPTQSTPPGGFSVQSTPPGGSSTPSGEVSLLIGVLCGVAGVVLVSAVSLAIWYRITHKVSPAP